mmetsp:Transcript_41078/g.46676  ORF Transcript_41078/g.46676 Transcript_41078/m.46676 type:complete len:418 (-) Transcript_41078:278-1531(-)
MPPNQKGNWPLIFDDAENEDVLYHEVREERDSGERVELAATAEYGRSPKELIKAVPSCYPSPLPFHLRLMARLTTMIVPALFIIGPTLLASPIFFLVLVSVRAALIASVVVGLLAFWPLRPWPFFRHYFQLWYELFDFHHNLSNLDKNDINNDNNSFEKDENIEDTSLIIYSNHPHGVIPMHGYLWAAFCDQNFPHRYGFGALTDIALRLPLLRQVMSWLSSAAATKKIIKQRMLEGGQNLWILPGGVSEIFLACPNQNVIKAPRRGLIKLALQTGAVLIPTYVFGVNEFYHQLATYGNENENSTKQHNDNPTNIIGKIQRCISRKLKGGFTFFWGQYGTTLPFESKCTMVLGDPIQPVPGTLGQEWAAGKKTCQRIPEPTEKQIDELWNRYTKALICLFEQYKVQAGYPDATLVLE